jgi:hypothetical protein
MALISNLRHFLNEDDSVPDHNPEAQALLRFLTGIVEAATLAFREPISYADVQCRTVVNDEACDGDIEVWLDPDDNYLGWECLECGEEGSISDWEGTPWDRRDFVVH